MTLRDSVNIYIKKSEPTKQKLSHVNKGLMSLWNIYLILSFRKSLLGRS